MIPGINIKGLVLTAITLGIVIGFCIGLVVGSHI